MEKVTRKLEFDKFIHLSGYEKELGLEEGEKYGIGIEKGKTEMKEYIILG